MKYLGKKIQIEISSSVKTETCSALCPHFWFDLFCLWCPVGMVPHHSCEATRRPVIGCAPTPPVAYRTRPAILRSLPAPASPPPLEHASTLDNSVCLQIWQCFLRVLCHNSITFHKHSSRNVMLAKLYIAVYHFHSIKPDLISSD